ncbi:hypothetical protein [Winogradskyella forsetii]|uniref:hypothetical protein n=1 Tax=Winogradskyella forsetii TaxID=2686077 RepID=UPI0015C16AEB|nr:hypothetical protein [Winogradskyella forsetii]
MKKIAYLLFALTFILTACEGDPGPPGFDGLDGLPADDFAARSFERTINFEYFSDTGLQESVVTLPTTILDRDAVLVYRLEGTVNVGGQPTDTWSPLPQNFFLEGSDIIQYIFNHTFADVELLIDGNFDLSTLESGFTQNQTFRIIVLPVENLNSVNISDMNEVMQTFNIDSFQ